MLPFVIFISLTHWDKVSTKSSYILKQNYSFQMKGCDTHLCYAVRIYTRNVMHVMQIHQLNTKENVRTSTDVLSDENYYTRWPHKWCDTFANPFWFFRIFRCYNFLSNFIGKYPSNGSSNRMIINLLSKYIRCGANTPTWTNYWWLLLS